MRIILNAKSITKKSLDKGFLVSLCLGFYSCKNSHVTQPFVEKEQGGISMNITLFGATGRVGSEILKLALRDGHHVTALVRTPSKLPTHNNLSTLTGDIRDKEIVSQAIENADAVISAIGTDKTKTLTVGIPRLI